ncbi:LOW QUALITY PROTEIN: uncharacterized protein Dere_GG26185 [Drosophila erecta]|uniref:Uncharacterized protein n=1 Tax=Drosophila erecta TaxID=7220 RepID=A0A0Q5TJQ4_DROER|nr:LOW QUALITY PROTEIN: uncharacterized protein Dere_GG26185 [Drosophila erecta]
MRRGSHSGIPLCDSVYKAPCEVCVPRIVRKAPLAFASHFQSAPGVVVTRHSTLVPISRGASSMWSKIGIAGALLVMGGILSSSVVDNFAYVDRSLPVAMPKAKAFQVKQE